jgi:hypothetical protein
VNPISGRRYPEEVECIVCASEMTLTKAAYIQNIIIHAIFHYVTSTDTSTASSSGVRTIAILVLLTIGS